MNRRALAIGAGAAVVVLLLWYFALWAPRNRAIDEERERAETAEQQRDDLRTRVARLRAAQRDEPLIRAKLETVRTAIPDQPNLAQFILDTNDAAVRSGIDFISIAPTPPKAAAATAGGAAGTQAAPATTAPPAAAGATPPAEVQAQLQIKGGYFQVLDFLNRLDALPRLVVTDALNLTADPQARLTAAATVRVFLRSVPPEFGGAAVPAAAVTPTTVAGATTTTTTAGANGTTTTVTP